MSSEVLRVLIRSLKGILSSEEIEPVAMLILEHLSGFSPTEIRAGKNILIAENDIEKIENIVLGLKKQQPIQHLLGEAWFYDRKFVVNEHVLIPRQETEELIYLIIKEYKGEKRILDIGTGSGCIAITLDKELPKAEIIGLDKSSDAIKIAQANKQLLNSGVRYVQMDILEQSPEGKFDIIVSNPPYVTLEDKNRMDKNVTDYEPGLALYVEGDPLLFYCRIVELSADLLNLGGKIYFEINELYGEQVAEILKEGNFTEIIIKKDLNGKDRFVSGKKKS